MRQCLLKDNEEVEINGTRCTKNCCNQENCCDECGYEDCHEGCEVHDLLGTCDKCDLCK